jgi:hypothetical protein
MIRGRLVYRVGQEQNPGNPFGRSSLLIESDGSVRLEHVPRGGGPTRAWTACLDEAALQTLWSELDRAGFPRVAQHMVPAGSTMRDLQLERPGNVSQSAMIEWHEALKLPGYAEVFALLDRAVRQISGDQIRLARASGEPIVREIADA